MDTMDLGDREPLAPHSIVAASDSIARVVRRSKTRQSTAFTPESAKATTKDLFAIAKARLGFGFGSSGARKESNPLNNAMAYKDISPAYAHPRAPRNVS